MSIKTNRKNKTNTGDQADWPLHRAGPAGCYTAHPAVPTLLPAVNSSSFSSLALSPAMLANLTQLGYHEMTPIQAASLPVVLDRRDLIAQARTGSGKTAAFGIGMLQRLNPAWFAVQGLVLCPTRELADQVANELRRLARFAANIKVLTLTGGMPMRPQKIGRASCRERV